MRFLVFPINPIIHPMLSLHFVQESTRFLLITSSTFFLLSSSEYSKCINFFFFFFFFPHRKILEAPFLIIVLHNGHFTPWILFPNLSIRSFLTQVTQKWICLQSSIIQFRLLVIQTLQRSSLLTLSSASFSTSGLGTFNDEFEVSGQNELKLKLLDGNSPLIKERY